MHPGDGGEDSDITKLGKTAADSQYYPNSQVLYLDWKDAASDSAIVTPPYDAAKRVRPVADWATKRLKELGIDPEKTILLGHSLGSYVASEIGRIGGKVKELVALDPAWPGGTDDRSYTIFLKM
jgi:pimeloyl-ACP methyl ester carboxylesterase